MARVTTGAYQATGKKMEGRVAQSNFARPAKIAPVKATEQLPPSATPKPFDRPAMPGVRVGGGRTANVGGIARSYPNKVTAGVHDVMPHKVNSGE
jgi:hypothetical protein